MLLIKIRKRLSVGLVIGKMGKFEFKWWMGVLMILVVLTILFIAYDLSLEDATDLLIFLVIIVILFIIRFGSGFLNPYADDYYKKKFPKKQEDKVIKKYGLK